MKELYVAVVATDAVADGLNMNDYISGRSNGDWACFIHRNRDEAVRRALTAAQKWAYKEGSYRVLLGTLTSKAIQRLNYVLEPLPIEL